MRQAHEKLAVALNAECYITDVPAVFSTLEERYLPEHRSAVAQLLARSQECRVVVFSPGTCTQTSRLFRSQLLSAAEKELLAQRAVGDICSHYVDANARICLPDANNRVAGLSLPDLRKVEQKILVAGGDEKIRGHARCLEVGLYKSVGGGCENGACAVSVRFFWRRAREVDANGAPVNKRTYEPCIPLKTFQLGTYVPKNPVETSMPRPNIGCERGTGASFTANHRYPVKSHESSQNV